MQTAEFDHNSFEHRQQSEEDKKLLVKFYIKPRPDNAETVKQGRPIFKDVEYVDIRIPGDRAGGVARPATDGDRQRFAPHYQAFKSRIEMPTSGTPLAEWPLITRSLAEELAFHNVKTVEHLSTMSDTHSSKFMGLNALKAKALKWLEQAGEEAKAHELQQKLIERDERIAQQGKQLEDMQAQLNQLLAAQQPAKQPDWPSGHSMPTPTTDPNAAAAAPSLHSELDEPVAEAPAADEPEPKAAAPAPAKKTRRRRKAADNGKIQNDK